MPAVEINLTTEQLVAAYAQLSQRERRAFLAAVLKQKAQPKIALELMRELNAVLQRKLPVAKQRVLDQLLEANRERNLRPSEQKAMDKIMQEYGADLVEKAQSRYVLELSHRAKSSAR